MTDIDTILAQDSAYNVTFTTSILPGAGTCCTIHQKGLRGGSIQGRGPTADDALRDAAAKLPQPTLPQLPGL